MRNLSSDAYWKSVPVKTISSPPKTVAKRLLIEVSTGVLAELYLMVLERVWLSPPMVSFGVQLTSFASPELYISIPVT